jgi:hypothetical protein
MPLRGEPNQLSARKGELFKPLLACKSSERADGLLGAQVDLNMLSSSSASVEALFLLLPQYLNWASFELFDWVRLGLDSWWGVDRFLERILSSCECRLLNPKIF